MLKTRSAQMSMYNITESFCEHLCFFSPQTFSYLSFQTEVCDLSDIYDPFFKFFLITFQKCDGQCTNSIFGCVLSQHIFLSLMRSVTLVIDLETVHTRYFKRILLQRTSYSLHGLFNNILVNNSGIQLYMLILPGFIHA